MKPSNELKHELYALLSDFAEKRVLEQNKTFGYIEVCEAFIYFLSKFYED